MTNNKERNDNIDILRGWLILFVIVGHLVLGSVHDNVIRYSIYAFHMPLFIGLSGYLINPLTLKSSGFLKVLSRYWRRVLLPFLVAFLFYTGVLIFHAYEEARLTKSLLVSYLHTPYYHLWFVPTLVIWVLAFWASLKLKFPIILSLSLCAIATFLWAIPILDSFDLKHPWSLFTQLLSKKVAYFFLFFMFGAYLRTAPKVSLLKVATDFKVLPMTIIVACFIVYLMDIGMDKSALKGISWLLMNLLLIVVCTHAMKQQLKSKQKKVRRNSKILAAIGRNSLPIYLWHVAPLFILKGFDLHQTQTVLYYCVSVIAITLICALVMKFENKSPYLNRVLYGA